MGECEKEKMRRVEEESGRMVIGRDGYDYDLFVCHCLIINCL